MLDQKKNNKLELDKNLELYKNQNEPSKKVDVPDNIEGFDHDAPP